MSTRVGQFGSPYVPRQASRRGRWIYRNGRWVRVGQMPVVGQAFEGTISAEVTFDSHEEIDAWLALRLDTINRDCAWRESSLQANTGACWRFVDPSVVFACALEQGRRYRQQLDEIRQFCEGERASARQYAAEAHARLDQRLAEERARLVQSAAEQSVSERTERAIPSIDPRVPLNLGTSPQSAARAAPRIGQSSPSSFAPPVPVGVAFQCTNSYGCELYNYADDYTQRWGIVGWVPYGGLVTAAPPLAVPPTNVFGGVMLADVSTPNGPRQGWVRLNQLSIVRTPATPRVVPNPRTRVSERIDVLQRGPYVPTEVLR